MEQFASYKPTTTLGASLTITALTGQYNSNKLPNLRSQESGSFSSSTRVVLRTLSSTA